MIVFMDASCTRFFTHNSSYMQAYAARAYDINMREPIECWIGEAADSRVIENFTFPVHPILRSPIYSFQKNRPAYYFRDKVLNQLLQFLSNSKKNGLLTKYARQKIFDFYAFPAVKRAGDLAKFTEKFFLVLPSADGLTIRLAKKLIDLGFPVKSLTIRTITAESRGGYGIENLSLFLESLQKEHPHVEIRIGWECKNVSEKFEQRNLLKNLLYWAPMPTNVSLEEKELRNPIHIGFLGNARLNKGFNNIPEILESLKHIGISTKYVVQLASDPWIGYEQTLSKILEEVSDVKFLDSRLTHEQLLSEISQVDLLIMPYSNIQYRYAGSGILYQAADFLVPSITFKGLGFSWDIESFKVGATVENFDQLKSLINLTNLEVWKKNCTLYNKARNQAVDFLLSLNIS